MKDQQKNTRKCLVGINSINKDIAHNSEDNKEKIQVLSLAKECYSMKLDLLTNASIADDAVKFVENISNNRVVKIIK